MKKQTAPPECDSPRTTDILLEARAPFEFLSTFLHLPFLIKAPKGDGRPIILLPGYMADKYSMWPLKKFLNHIGYRSHDWGLGRNNGQVNKDIEKFATQIEKIYQQYDQQPITLIGWSLGGVIAREAARLNEKTVKEVITFGTPVIGGPKYTSIGKKYAQNKGLDLDEFEIEVHQRNSIGIKQAVTSIYSQTDGIVGWQASVDVYNQQAQNLEVKSSHLGMGVNHNVWRLIARILANNN